MVASCSGTPAPLWICDRGKAGVVVWKHHFNCGLHLYLRPIMCIMLVVHAVNRIEERLQYWMQQHVRTFVVAALDLISVVSPSFARTLHHSFRFANAWLEVASSGGWGWNFLS